VHVLVTGGAGFIGSHTVEALIEEGAQIRVLDDFSSGRESNLPLDRQLSVVKGDIRDADLVRESMEGITHVLHLAAQVSVQLSVDDPLASASVNVGGFLTVLDAARIAGVQRFVYASSAAVYGVPQELPLEESSSVRPVSPYGLDKLVNEQYADLYRRLYGVPCLGLRYFNVYGTRQDPASPYSGVISIFLERITSGAEVSVFGDGEQSRDFVYVKDIAQANTNALRSDNTGVVNVASGRSVTLLELIAGMEAACGKTALVAHVDKRPGDIRHSHGSAERMQKWLGPLQLTPLELGLRKLCGAEGNPGEE
jgi:UDP-glucose 4-epimerase